MKHNLSDRLREIVRGDLAPERFAEVQRRVYGSMEMIVGRRLSDLMTNEQLDEFEVFIDADDEAGAFAYLEANLPLYADIVNQVLEEHLFVVAAALHIGLLDLA